MPTRIVLLRHAESADPTVLHGVESDIGLSPRGIRQAAAVAPHVAAYEPVAVISSNMLRARLTAAPIAAACGLPVLVEPDLHERRLGGLSGAPARPPHPSYVETVRRWMAGETAYAPDGAESLDDLRRRVLPVWDRLAAAYRGRTVAVVAHGMVCKALLFSRVAGYAVADWAAFGPVFNVAIHELHHAEAGWCAARVNFLPDSVSGL